jgi:hypothetical protein
MIYTLSAITIRRYNKYFIFTVHYNMRLLVLKFIVLKLTFYLHI